MCVDRACKNNNLNSEDQIKSIIQKFAIGLVAILSTTVLFLIASLAYQKGFAFTLADSVGWLRQVDQDAAFQMVSNIIELLAAVLAIAITVIAIVVELAANRYSHRITSLFVREPINIVVLSFFVVATIYSIWIAIALDGGAGDPNSVVGMFASLSMATLSLAVLLPYFAFVLSFLSPVSVVGKIQNTALNALKSAGKGTTSDAQETFLSAVDDLQDIARRSSELSDRAVETVSINSMLDLLIDYQDLKKTFASGSQGWFELGDAIVRDPDFVSINQGSLDKIVREKIWVEVKILRQYLDLMSDSNSNSRDTTYLIAINTKRFALEAQARGQGLEAVALCMRCFNSYLRVTINKKDVRTCYYIMNQYRMLASELLARHEKAAMKDIALFLQFYGLLGFQQGIPFLLEVAAEDVAELTGQCIGHDEQLLDDLLGLLLDIDQEIKHNSQEESLLGVRRAQLKVAAMFMEAGDEQRATRICEDLKSEARTIKERLIGLLQADNRKEYWEFTDRGVNFAYLPPELKRHLPALAPKFMDASP